MINKLYQTVSFMAYIIRTHSDELANYQDLIPSCIIQLLQNCPPEFTGTRKELLVATRHILSSDFRKAFINHMDFLLNENILLGVGITSFQTLRAMAFSMLADLIHHIRQDLTPPQVEKIIKLYSRNLHDPTLPYSIQTMSAKLLLNLIDWIVKPDQRSDKRHLLIAIFDTFVNKFGTIKTLIPEIIYHQNKKNESKDEQKELSDEPYLTFEIEELQQG